MSAIGDLRAAVVSGVAALPGLEGIPVTEVAVPEDAFAVCKRLPGVAIAFTGIQRGAGELTISGSVVPVRATFAVVVMARDWRTPAGAAGSLDDMADAVRALRGVALGSGRTVRLIYEGEAVVDPPDRPESGGPMSRVLRFRTTDFTL